MKKTLLYIYLVSILFISCQSDDENNVPKTIVTSFSGIILYENGDQVTTGELAINGIESTLVGGVSRDGVILSIDNGTFEAVLETEENVNRYSIVLSLSGNVFSFGEGLQCIPGNCRNFPPGELYEITIIVPCTPNDCTPVDS